jgi:hypothetical protein
MSENMPVCGTGAGNFPKPGDPDLRSTITAKYVFSGIEVRWTYPNILAHAVQYTLLYRSQSSDFATALTPRIVPGNFFLDPLDVEESTDYYYWIRMVSVNGTEGELVGPAKATAAPTILSIIEGLEGQIAASALAAELRSDIGRITDVSSSLTDEEQNRLFGDNIITQMLEGLEASLGEIGTLVYQGTLERADENEALVAQVNLILAKFEENRAAILDESVVRATADGAIAQRVTTVQTEVDSNLTSVQQKFIAVDNQLQGVYSQYTVKLSARSPNGTQMIGGFGLFNDGITNMAIFNVNTFAIGVASTGLTKFPFIVTNGQVFIKDAMIAKAAITNANIKNGTITAAKIGNAQIDTLRIGKNSVVVAAAKSGTKNGVSLGFNAKGGTVFATVSCIVSGNEQNSLSCSLSAGGSSQVAYNDSSSSGNVTFVMPMSCSGITGPANNITVSARFSGGATVSSVLLSVAAYRR